MGQWVIPIRIQFQPTLTQRFPLRTSRLCVSLKSFLMRQPCGSDTMPVPDAVHPWQMGFGITDWRLSPENTRTK
jgi:hypothetical protein